MYADHAQRRRDLGTRFVAAEDLTRRLAPIRAAVAAIDVASREGAYAHATTAADELISMTSQLVDELAHDTALDEDARAAVIAACGVYRNAAFAFRSLAGITGKPDPQMATVVGSLVELGNHHLRSIRPTPKP